MGDVAEALELKDQRAMVATFHMLAGATMTTESSILQSYGQTGNTVSPRTALGLSIVAQLVVDLELHPIIPIAWDDVMASFPNSRTTKSYSIQSTYNSDPAFYNTVKAIMETKLIDFAEDVPDVFLFPSEPKLVHDLNPQRSEAQNALSPCCVVVQPNRLEAWEELVLPIINEPQEVDGAVMTLSRPQMLRLCGMANEKTRDLFSDLVLETKTLANYLDLEYRICGDLWQLCEGM